MDGKKDKKSAAVCFKRAVQAVKDVVVAPVNFAWLLATFIFMYFIVLYNLPLKLIVPANKLLSYFRIKNSGKSYT